MLVVLAADTAALDREAARIVAHRIREKPAITLGLASGSTPLGMYRELIRLHREEGLDLSGVTTFNLDEYLGLASFYLGDRARAQDVLANVRRPDGRADTRSQERVRADSTRPTSFCAIRESRITPSDACAP